MQQGADSAEHGMQQEQGMQPFLGLQPCQPLRVAFPGQGVALQARAHGDVADGAAAAATLDRDPGGFGSHWRGCNHNPRDLHKVGHLLRLEGGKVKGRGESHQ